MARDKLPASTEEREELIPDGERIDIFYKTTHGERYEVDDRRPRYKRPGGMKKEMYHVHYNSDVGVDVIKRERQRMLMERMKIQYEEENVYGMVVQPTFTSSYLYNLDNPSVKGFFNDALNVALEGLNKKFEKINKAIKKASGTGSSSK